MSRQKTAVVTGGANGIGKCIADEFRKTGVKVYVIDKTDGDHYAGDISKKEDLEAFAGKVISECGSIDYLINNAPPLMKGIDDCSYEEFEAALAAGVTAPFYLAKLFAPHFGEGASIVNISSSRDRMLCSSHAAVSETRWILRTWSCSCAQTRQVSSQERISALMAA